jgi:hypothetical protein
MLYEEALDHYANAIAETVEELGSPAPLGPMYAAFMVAGLSLEAFDAVINRLVARGGWRRTSELLIKEGTHHA